MSGILCWQYAHFFEAKVTARHWRFAIIQTMTAVTATGKTNETSSTKDMISISGSPIDLI